LIVGKRLAKTLANAAHHKLATDIELLEVKKYSSYTDFLLILSGKNRLHLDALQETLKEMLMDRDVSILGIEGSAQSGWVIIDVGSIIVHIFDPEKRSYYNLYALWGDAPSVDLEFSKKPPARRARKSTPEKQ
jgi:ribosome-associated protein